MMPTRSRFPLLLRLALFATMVALLAGCTKAPANKPAAEPAASAAAPNGAAVAGTYTDLDLAAWRAGASKSGAIKLDVRTPSEVSAAHVAGAKHIDVLDSSFAAKAAKLAKDKPVYVYCRSGNRSGRAGRMLQRMGFAHVYNLRGGITGWQGAGLPTETGAIE